MRKLFFGLILTLVCSTQVSAQIGTTIDSITVSPASPLATDTIYVFAHLTFPSGSCDLQTSALTQTGTTLNGIATHCVGMLAVMCYKTDTFKIQPQPPGNYKFVLSLFSGATIPPCTPTLADEDSVNFTVNANPAGINNTAGAADLSAHYGNGQLTLHSLPAGFGCYDLRITSMAGQQVFYRRDCGRDTRIAVDLSAGMYLVTLSNGERRLIGKIMAE